MIFWNGSEPAFFFRYSWRSTEWSECRVDVLLSQQDRRRGNQTSLCGGGIQTREVYCVQISSDPGSLRGKEGNFTSNLLPDTFVASLLNHDRHGHDLKTRTDWIFLICSEL